ncbi:unnamed protein product [Mytilus edulis]|uniref:Uncharacterized protein n=1 Tax=Mytilus edulis TaxID=6550 RepID=A0A8S3V2Y1_MYTED|nr:unnamed protein product [Mytilus edulis]
MGKFKGLLCGVGKKKKKKDEVPDIEKEGKPDDNCSNPNKDCKGSKSAVVKDQLLTEVYTPVNETENGLIVISSQDSGIETVEEDGSSLGITNYNNVDKLAQFSNPWWTRKPVWFKHQGKEVKLLDLGKVCAAADHMIQDQSSSQSVNSVLSRAANDDTDQATQEEEK